MRLEQEFIISCLVVTSITKEEVINLKAELPAVTSNRIEVTIFQPEAPFEPARTGISARVHRHYATKD